MITFEKWAVLCGVYEAPRIVCYGLFHGFFSVSSLNQNKCSIQSYSIRLSLSAMHTGRLFGVFSVQPSHLGIERQCINNVRGLGKNPCCHSFLSLGIHADLC